MATTAGTNVNSNFIIHIANGIPARLPNPPASFDNPSDPSGPLKSPTEPPIKLKIDDIESCIIFAPGNAIYAKLEVTYVIKVSCARFAGFLFPFILVSNAACSF